MSTLRGNWALSLLLALSLGLSAAAASWPNGPLSTSGRWITDASGANVTYVGVNWPGASETMIPEGLQYQSVASMVSKIKSLGMNSIRLTYAIEMIDQIYENNGQDIPVLTAFTTALGQENGTRVFNEILTKNPSFSANTTRLEVFDAVAAECAKQEIYVHLDNHVSKASWCCTPLDGNSWWGDKYFDVGNWTRGLGYMADRGKSWPALTSMSLRNELRQPLTDGNLTLFQNSYNWQDWYKYTKLGAAAIHEKNTDLLIFLSGMDSDTRLDPVVQATALTPGNGTFSLDDFSGYSNKLVLELHAYEITTTVDNCTKFTADLTSYGYSAVNVTAADVPRHAFPVVMTEFGFTQDATTWKDVYATCLASFLPAQKSGWMIWALGGSYYIRSGEQDYNETWGLLTKDGSEWRSPDFVNGGLKPMIEATFKAVGDSSGSGNGTNSTGSNGGSGNGTSTSAAVPRYGDGVGSVIWVLAPLALLVASL
ncbi:glycoside hydrolase [Thozetella sp. PMI_491]|nr:glycoside hydrolase [Thozetella sp. PMI_491]